LTATKPLPGLDVDEGGRDVNAPPRDPGQLEEVAHVLLAFARSLRWVTQALKLASVASAIGWQFCCEVSRPMMIVS